MSISDIEMDTCKSDCGKPNHSKRMNNIYKTSIVYLIFSAVCIIITNIYALFGHGVRSANMNLMFLYPLVGGTLLFAVMGLTLPKISQSRYFRSGFNIYNSGIATLTAGSLFTGILEIAGTESMFSGIFFVTGSTFLLAGLLIFARCIIRGRS